MEQDKHEDSFKEAYERIKKCSKHNHIKYMDAIEALQQKPYIKLSFPASKTFDKLEKLKYLKQIKTDKGIVLMLAGK